MPLGTDLSKLLRKDEPATVQEAEAIRLQLNQLQSQVSALSGLVDAQGNLHPNVFSHKASTFSILPGESASMYRSITQTIPYNTYTTVTFEVDADLTAAEKRLSWAHGMRRDTSTGEFFLEGISEDALCEFTAMVYWIGAEIPNNWAARVIETDTASLAHIIFTDTGFFEIGTAMLRARKAATSWKLQVLNADTGAGAKDLYTAWFQIKRIR